MIQFIRISNGAKRCTQQTFHLPWSIEAFKDLVHLQFIFLFCYYFDLRRKGACFNNKYWV